MDPQPPSVPEPSPQTPPPPIIADQKWPLWVHLSVLAGFVIPFGNIIGPLIIWLLKRQEIPAVEQHGREVLNFQISFAIYFCVAFVLIYAFIGVLIVPVLAILWLVFTIIGIVKASKDEFYRFPLTIRML